MSNLFLDSIRKDLQKQGEIINIDGNEFLVIDTADQIAIKLYGIGLDKGRFELQPQRASLSKLPITKADRDQFKREYGSFQSDEVLSKTLENFKTHFDLKLYEYATRYVASNITSEIVRNIDGSKIYETDEERESVNEILEANAEAMKIINEAFNKVREKKSSKTALPKN